MKFRSNVSHASWNRVSLVAEAASSLAKWYSSGRSSSVIHSLSLTATARYLGIPLSTLKHKMARLELRDLARKLRGV